MATKIQITKQEETGSSARRNKAEYNNQTELSQSYVQIGQNRY